MEEAFCHPLPSATFREVLDGTFQPPICLLMTDCRRVLFTWNVLLGLARRPRHCIAPALLLRRLYHFGRCLRRHLERPRHLHYQSHGFRWDRLTPLNTGNGAAEHLVGCRVRRPIRHSSPLNGRGLFAHRWIGTSFSSGMEFLDVLTFPPPEPGLGLLGHPAPQPTLTRLHFGTGPSATST